MKKERRTITESDKEELRKDLVAGFHGFITDVIPWQEAIENLGIISKRAREEIPKCDIMIVHRLMRELRETSVDILRLHRLDPGLTRNLNVSGQIQTYHSLSPEDRAAILEASRATLNLSSGRPALEAGIVEREAIDLQQDDKTGSYQLEIPELEGEEFEQNGTPEDDEDVTES